jgi:hypothetical protein
VTAFAGRQLSSAAAGILALVVLALAVALRLGVEGQVPLATAGLALAVVCIAVPFGGLLFLGFLAPFDGYISSVVVYRDLLAVDLIGLALIVGEWRRGWRFPTRPATMAALTALFALFVFNVLSLGPANWTHAWDNAARLAFWCVVMAAIISTRQHTHLRPVCAGLVLGIAVRFGYEAYLFVTNPGFVLHPAYQFGNFTSNPNTMAGFGACVLPMAAAFMVSTASRRMRVVAAITTMSLLLGIVLSFSKGSWLAAAAASAVWSFHGLRTGFLTRRAMVRTVVVLALLVLLVPSLRRMPGLMLQRWMSHGSAVSNQERLRYIETAVSLILEHPVSGVGLERFGEEYLKTRRLVRGPDDPHNGYLMVAVELGIPALGCLLLFQALVAVSAFVSVREGPAAVAPLYAALSAGVAALLVFQMFSAEPLTARTALVVMALCLTVPSIADHEEGDV